MIMPLVDFYATACDWWTVSHRPPPGLLWFVIVSYFNGVVIEVGRKIRPAEDEEEGQKPIPQTNRSHCCFDSLRPEDQQAQLVGSVV